MFELVRYRTGEGCYVTIIAEGRKWISGVWIGASVSLHPKIARTERRHMTPLPGSVLEAAVKMAKAGAALGMTKGAAEFLLQAAKSA